MQYFIFIFLVRSNLQKHFQFETFHKNYLYLVLLKTNSIFMKKQLLLYFITLLFFNCTAQNSSYEKEIKEFQYELNTSYADTSTSPLTTEDIKTFKALDFFNINEKFKVEATLTLTPNEPIFEMQTTTDRLPLYRKYAVASFSIDGKNFKLSLYQNQQNLTSMEYSNLLFLPFNDSSNGKTSYGGGRFIDIEIPENSSKSIIIDFNKAYNPYCAYNHKYSCPIPPKENLLAIPIAAGVKAYKKH
jgi:uncharacterized protein (DUF1684 family)